MTCIVAKNVTKAAEPNSKAILQGYQIWTTKLQTTIRWQHRNKENLFVVIS